jgi:hypothetical protein
MDPLFVAFWGGVLILFVLYIVASWRVFAKAGYGALGKLIGTILMLIPPLNMIMVIILGFGRWSMQKGGMT